MDEATAKELLDTANQSGFPFQIGVRREIERTAFDHGWEIVAEELHWTSPDSRKSGFIDLIAEHTNFIFSLVIECKRVRAKGKKSGQEPRWIFLTPREYTARQSRLSGFATVNLKPSPHDDPSRKPQPNRWAWVDGIDFGPSTPESSYCMFDGQEETNPTIERIADILLPSVETVGLERLTHVYGYSGERRLLLPVIVTNATLYTCTFDPDKVSMADGCLPPGVSDFQEVPFVRFRKGLFTSLPPRSKHRDFKEANRQQQRTILIMNSASLASTLTQLNMKEEGKLSLWNEFQRLIPFPLE